MVLSNVQSPVTFHTLSVSTLLNPWVKCDMHNKKLLTIFHEFSQFCEQPQEGQTLRYEWHSE